MKKILASLGLTLMCGLTPMALAEEAAPATDEAGSVSPVQAALDGLFVSVLQDASGNVASIQNSRGENAVVAFLEPAAAKVAMEESEGEQMIVAVTPLIAILEGWNGPVVFEASAAEITSANELNPANEKSFQAPVYFVTSDGKETRIGTDQGTVTPILLSYDDALGMAEQMKAQGVAEATIDIVALEFAAVLQQIDTMKTESSYQFFTHPDTIEFIQSAQAAAQAASQQ